MNKKFGMFAFFTLMFFLFPAIVMWLWNALLPDIFAVKSISYWQAAGLLLLSKILFGRMDFGKHRSHHNSKFCHRHKNMKLTDDEKERLKQKWESFKNKD